jgi:hypothetical protein
LNLEKDWKLEGRREKRETRAKMREARAEKKGKGFGKRVS